MNQDIDRSAVRNPRHYRRFIGVLATALLLSGCSAVPDWADPTDWFATDQVPTKVGLTQDQSANAQSAAFPNLASVPDRAPKIMSPERRTVVRESLVADRGNAVYSGEKLVGAAPSQPATAQPKQFQPASTQPGSTQAVAVQPAAPSLRVPAPPAPEIAGQLGAAVPAPAQTQIAQTQIPQTQVAQTQVGQTQVAHGSSGQTQLRFPQFQNAPPQVGAAPALSALPAAAGAQLVAVVYFAHASSRLDGNDRGVLRDIAALHRQRGGVIRVVGHASAQTGVTDQIAHSLANFEMSLKRANAVAAALVALGVAKDRVRAEARGDNQPVYHEFMTTGQAGNRRAEIFLEN